MIEATKLPDIGGKVEALVWTATLAVCLSSSLAPRVLAGDADGGLPISARRIMSHTRRLASDQFQGRAPGSGGETLTVSYLTEQLRAAGVEPAGPGGSWTQVVPMTGYRVTNEPVLSVDRADGGVKGLRLQFGSEHVSWSLRQSPWTGVDGAKVVFVGYGVVAPEYGWDDFKSTDVTGKVLLMLVGDPPHPDASLFDGEAMTYYGRWTYKFDVAAARGAAAVILIHTEAEAGYPWDVVKNSWTGEQFELERSGGERKRCPVETWVSTAAAEKIFSAAGTTLAEARLRAVSKEFEPRELDLTVNVRVESTSRAVSSRNVVGWLPGSRGEATYEHIVYTAHWDHLGCGAPVDGDSIYNGALDNATGVAGVLEIARAFARRRDDLSRSVLFIFTTAEESGLLGARHYVQHPLVPLEGALAVINVDGLNVWGRTSDVVVIGQGRSDLEDYLAAVVADQGRHVRPDGSPEKGYYYRSDHFAFAERGVPALFAESGSSFRGRPKGWGSKARIEYLEQRYHRPGDEVQSWWDLTGAVEDMEMLFQVGWKIATTGVYPKWKTTDSTGPSVKETSR